MLSPEYAVVIPCGKKKLPKPAPARYIYQGSLFKAGLRWATSVAPEDQIFILSAKHGFLSLDKVVAPYELFMGDEGSISLDSLKEQACSLKIINKKIYALGGDNYKAALAQVFTKIMFPVPRVRFGFVMQMLKKNFGKVPKWVG